MKDEKNFCKNIVSITEDTNARTFTYTCELEKDEPLKIAVWGCAGTKETEQRKVAEAIATLKPDYCTVQGDNIYSKGAKELKRIYEYIVSPLASIEAVVSLKVGNHDRDIGSRPDPIFYNAKGSKTRLHPQIQSFGKDHPISLEVHQQEPASQLKDTIIEDVLALKKFLIFSKENDQKQTYLGFCSADNQYQEVLLPEDSPLLQQGLKTGETTDAQQVELVEKTVIAKNGQTVNDYVTLNNKQATSHRKYNMCNAFFSDIFKYRAKKGDDNYKEIEIIGLDSNTFPYDKKQQDWLKGRIKNCIDNKRRMIFSRHHPLSSEDYGKRRYNDKDYIKYKNHANYLAEAWKNRQSLSQSELEEIEYMADYEPTKGVSHNHVFEEAFLTVLAETYYEHKNQQPKDLLVDKTTRDTVLKEVAASGDVAINFCAHNHLKTLVGTSYFNTAIEGAGGGTLQQNHHVIEGLKNEDVQYNDEGLYGFGMLSLDPAKSDLEYKSYSVDLAKSEPVERLHVAIKTNSDMAINYPNNPRYHTFVSRDANSGRTVNKYYETTHAEATHQSGLYLSQTYRLGIFLEMLIYLGGCIETVIDGIEDQATLAHHFFTVYRKSKLLLAFQRHYFSNELTEVLKSLMTITAAPNNSPSYEEVFSQLKTNTLSTETTALLDFFEQHKALSFYQMIRVFLQEKFNLPHYGNHALEDVLRMERHPILSKTGGETESHKYIKQELLHIENIATNSYAYRAKKPELYSPADIDKTIHHLVKRKKDIESSRMATHFEHRGVVKKKQETLVAIDQEINAINKVKKDYHDSKLDQYKDYWNAYEKDQKRLDQYIDILKTIHDELQFDNQPDDSQNHMTKAQKQRQYYEVSQVEVTCDLKPITRTQVHNVVNLNQYLLIEGVNEYKLGYCDAHGNFKTCQIDTDSDLGKLLTEKQANIKVGQVIPYDKQLIGEIQTLVQENKGKTERAGFDVVKHNYQNKRTQIENKIKELKAVTAAPVRSKLEDLIAHDLTNFRKDKILSKQNNRFWQGCSSLYHTFFGTYLRNNTIQVLEDKIGQFSDQIKKNPSA